MMSETRIHRRLAGPRGAGFGRWLACAAAARFLVGCLPGDARPTPATLNVTVQPSPEITDGVVTADGWHISFERFLVWFGGAAVYTQLDMGCTPYSDSGYYRLFDFTVAGPQKVADVYALGESCELSVSMSNFDSDGVPAEGVTASDLAFMQAPRGDSYGYVDGLGTYGFGARPTLYVRGRASRNNVTKRFEWSFGDFAGSSCTLALRGGDVLPFNIVFHGEEIFRGGLEREAALRFDALANADTDADQTITLQELVDAPPEPSFGRLIDAFSFLLNTTIPLSKDGGFFPLPPDGTGTPPPLPDTTCAPR
jgi:hypothetical protein